MPKGTTLAGLRVVVSAGPTYEDLDPVRFIGNRSSGKMGFAIAAAAARRGAKTVLVAGPVHLESPEGVERIDVRSAAQMHDAVLGALPADVYVAAAAVADFTPEAVAPAKIKKVAGQDALVLRLVRTPDILADVARDARRPRFVVGFAAETDDVATYARGKLDAKRIDMIAANRVGIAGSGFESDDNALSVFWREPGGTVGARALGPSSKVALADALLDLIEEHMPA
jgi:phosphopantothenoylcysteine decarboxylase/phosphopantothenate--cysteine ligase